MTDEYSGDVMDVLAQLFEAGAAVLDGDAAAAEHCRAMAREVDARRSGRSSL